MSDQQTTTLDRESRIRQFLIFVLFSGTGMAAGFDLAEPQIQVNPHRGDVVARAERYVQRLWVYAPIGTATGVAAGLVFGYALRRVTWGESGILTVLSALVLGLGTLGRACVWMLFIGGLTCGLGALIALFRQKQ